MTSLRHIKRRVKISGKAAAYSPVAKYAALKFMAIPSTRPVRKFIRTRGLEDHVRRIASESLPEGSYYAKLTIGRWEAYEGKPFRLLSGSTVVYGNQIEPPTPGFPLEYRNIIVNSKDKTQFRLDIEAPYKLAISRGSFTTPQQTEFDLKYKVIQHGDAYYSIRGNTTNPKKLLLTFPGFGMSTSRVSYTISYMKDITEVDLKDTLMVCFQDRYLAAGSYMMTDNSGNPLYDRLWKTIESLRSKYKIDPSQILFFGVSKGGSIALHYAKDYPEAQLVVGVPQMDLPYYFNKPSFRDNLFQNRTLSDLEQPEDLLRRYFDEGRRIDYFYTNSDELSNHSAIEFAYDVPNLTKYRIDGQHSAVGRTALPAMLGIIRRFLVGPKNVSFRCEEIRTFTQDNLLQVQVRVDPNAAKLKRANWFLEGRQGRTRFLQLISEHTYDFVKFSSEDQQLFSAYDLTDDISDLTAIDVWGRQWNSVLPKALTRDSIDVSRTLVTSGPIILETEEFQEHAVLNGKHFGRFKYYSRRVTSDGDAVEVHFVAELGTRVPDLPSSVREHKTSYVVEVQSLDGGTLANLMALRIAVAAKTEKLIIQAHDPSLTAKSLAQLASIRWSDKTVVVCQEP